MDKINATFLIPFEKIKLREWKMEVAPRGGIKKKKTRLATASFLITCGCGILVKHAPYFLALFVISISRVI